jgi:hypothetical protein
MDEYKKAIDAPSRDETDPENVRTDFTYGGTFPKSITDVISEGDVITIRTEMLETYQMLTVAEITDDEVVTFESSEDRPIIDMLLMRVESVPAGEIPTIEELEEERHAQLEQKISDEEDAEIRVDYDTWQVWQEVKGSQPILDLNSTLKDKEMPVFTLVNQTTERYYGSPDQILMSAF